MVQAQSQTLSHEERTAAEPRGADLHQVILDHIEPVNKKIKLFRLAIKDKRHGIKFRPGQWLDVHVPGVEKAGGFTITSTPREALPDSSIASNPFLELAIQDSPENPPAAWLWRAPDQILGTEIAVRVGGSFVWPPPDVQIEQIKRVILIAGGVGINPLISILSHIRETSVQLEEIRFLYTTKMPPDNPKASEILFLPRLLKLIPEGAEQELENAHLELYFTNCSKPAHFLRVDDLDLCFPPENDRVSVGSRLPVLTHFHRINEGVLARAVGHDARARISSVYYVCGPPVMTDSIVDSIRAQDHIMDKQVLCEKWW